MVLPKGISILSLTKVVGSTVQYPTSITTAVTNTEGIHALVKVETTSPMMNAAAQITNASAKLYIFSPYSYGAVFYSKPCGLPPGGPLPMYVRGGSSS
ncbi:hypothetical protein SDC9_90206 [bioreactor metagenome]|uniref:Uncharacterized protein n=1 Tax=bioreactor metagenome TaxID=1076179 RepID=A0A644ZRB5_9ZZZZ